jgi:hypothetical protein
MGDSFSRGQQKAYMAVLDDASPASTHLLVPAGTSGEVHVALRAKWVFDPCARRISISVSQLLHDGIAACQFKLCDGRLLEVNLVVDPISVQQAGMM